MGICTSCARETRVFKNRKFGLLLCMSCKVRMHINNKDKHEFCSNCGRHRFPAARTDGKKPLCATCALHYKCKVCKKRSSKRLIHRFCEECKPNKYHRWCSSCSVVISPRTKGSLCYKCWSKAYVKKKRREICIFCNKLSTVAVRFGDGSISCGNCRKKHLAPHNFCTVCGAFTYTFYNKMEKSTVCGRCDTAIREGKL